MDVFQELGTIMSHFSQGLDLVPSDIASALLLLHTKHKEEQPQLWVPPTAAYAHLVDTATLVESAYFMHYASASYGWPLFLKNNMCPVGVENFSF